MGFLGGHKFKCLGKLSNGWIDWHQIWYKTADSSGNGHKLNTIRPSIPQGVLGGSQIQKSWEVACQTTGLIGTKFGTRLRIRLGMDIGYSPLNITGGIFVGFRGSQIQKSLLKLSNGWTDWHQIWYAAVDSSGNGHRLKTFRRPTIPHGGILGGFRGSTIQRPGKCGQTAG